MSDLTIQELKEKIAMVEKDIERCHNNVGAIKKFEVLTEYKKYLEDELQFIKNNS